MPRRPRITPHKVFLLLQEHGAMTADELAMRMGHGKDGVPAVEAALEELKRTHQIGWVGEDFPREWQIED